MTKVLAVRKELLTCALPSSMDSRLLVHSTSALDSLNGPLGRRVHSQVLYIHQMELEPNDKKDKAKHDPHRSADCIQKLSVDSKIERSSESSWTVLETL